MKKDKPIQPPTFFLRFFRWFCHPELKSYIEGDLMELYDERLKEWGKPKADLRFIFDVLLLFRPGIVRPARIQYSVNNYAMFKSYFKIGWRSLLKNKGYSFINIGGLALGMAVAMVIALWVYDEISYNRYFRNYDSIAQIMKGGYFDGRHYVGQESLPFPLIDELKNNYGDNFKHIVPASWKWEGVLSSGDKVISKTGMYIGEDAPEMFSWKMLSGSWSGLKDPHSIMISASTAKALFGNNDPINKLIKINSGQDAKVAGVFEDFPSNTEFFRLQFVQPWEFLLMDASWMKQQDWQNHFLQIYAQVQPGSTFEKAGENIKDAEMKAIKNLDYMQDYLKYNFEILLHPMRDWHLHGDFREGVLQNGPLQFVWFIGSIGVFVLLLACINFMNLSTARSEKRAKEVGIRKTIGSMRGQLINQFFSESFLVVALASVFAVVMVTASLPWFNQLAVKQMRMPWDQRWFWISGLAFIFITGLLSGSYPALYLSSFKPVSILKGAFRPSRFAAMPRKVLVIIQFTVSVILVICTGVIYNQLMFVKNRPVGYARDGLLMITKKSDAFDKKADVLRTELRKTGAVTEIAESGGSVTSIWANNDGFNWQGKDPSFNAEFATLNVSPEFGKTVGWEFTQGRDFSAEMASDSAGFVLNESAVKYMGLKNPVGEVVRWTNRAWNVDQEFRVVGVIKDMIMGSPFEPVHPAIYFTLSDKRVLLLRVTPGMSTSEALPKIQSVFANIIPDIPFNYSFADQEYATKFATEDRIGKLAAVFATLAIVISCLGLFGLASFVAEQRTKEIGIRKVLGATIANLWSMLSREFVVLVIVSCVIAVPVSYYILSQGLDRYEYRTEIAWWIFASAGLGALVITLATVSYQAIRAALGNPVKSLRSE